MQWYNDCFVSNYIIIYFLICVTTVSHFASMRFLTVCNPLDSINSNEQTENHNAFLHEIMVCLYFIFMLKSMVLVNFGLNRFIPIQFINFLLYFSWITLLSTTVYPRFMLSKQVDFLVLLFSSITTSLPNWPGEYLVIFKLSHSPKSIKVLSLWLCNQSFIIVFL